jgi:hypothetical protein
MYELIAHILREAQRAGGVAGNADLTAEARHLCALLDGLALQATLWPERLPPRPCDRYCGATSRA